MQYTNSSLPGVTVAAGDQGGENPGANPGAGDGQPAADVPRDAVPVRPRRSALGAIFTLVFTFVTSLIPRNPNRA